MRGGQTEQKRKDAAQKRKDEAASLLEIQQQNTLDLIDDLTKRAFEELKIQEQKELASVALMDNAEEMKLAIQKKFDIKKIGHAGTLDPKAEGILPIAINKTTKLIPFVNSGLKKYLFKIKWGEQTSTCLLYTSPSPRDVEE